MNQLAPTPLAAATPPAGQIADFIRRWDASAAAERANYALFLTQLCDLLGVPQPEPTTDDVEKNAYVFERDVTFQEPDGSTSIGRIDLYKRSCFVLEAKQGSDAESNNEDSLFSRGARTAFSGTKRKKGTAIRGTPAWDDAMIRARGQADRYARALPGGEGWPAFLIVVDVGHVIELYSEFTRQGKTYVPFPDPQSFRIKLADLADPAIRERLKLVWTDPLALDPSRKSAKVTRDLASRLAELAKLLEKAGHEPARVARFLMRCLFTMFAEDVELIPKDAFKKLLTELEGNPAAFPPMIESLWQTMNAGGFSTILRQTVLRFNGGLFAEHEALPLTAAMLKLLRQASEAFWGDVEPAIFGTLLERALDPVERHKLGAHYTPRAYVERLVLPTIIEPLRDEWNTTYATALAQARAGKLDQAHTLVRQFHEKLCETRVLDPACGSGNFLYVTLEHMKRLEGEVLNALRELGYQQRILLEIDPHQFLGIEINPRAAAIADLVLWIGYLQWHFRTRGKATPAEPIIKDYDNIECRDAVLAWDRTEPLLDEAGQPVTRWDGRTTKRHPVTGEEVPDETARTAVLQYINPRKAEWPKADYAIGNPPFIGNKRMVFHLGQGYVDALRTVYSDVTEAADLVMYWWHIAGLRVGAGTGRRFGLITTNSITQPFNRAIVKERLESENPVRLSFAIPDHPWVESSDGAAVRIAMTVGVNPTLENSKALLVTVLHEAETPGDEPNILTLQEQVVPKINADLSGGADSTSATPLQSNADLSHQGVTPLGEGFRLTREDVEKLGFTPGKLPPVVKRYSIGRDLVQHGEERFIIDFFGHSDDDAKSDFPSLFQIVLDRVKPERDQKNRESYRKKWWVFAEPRANLRPALQGIPRYVATCRTARHRIFTFLPSDVLPDAKIVAIGLGDAWFLGVLSCRIHVHWAMTTGGWLGVGNDSNYNHSDCFAQFPFPDAKDSQKGRIRDLAEQLDAHRKRQQALHPWLTLTDMYNVLEKLRAADRRPAVNPGAHAGSLGRATGLGAGVNPGGHAGSGASTRDAGSVSSAAGLGAGVNPGGHAGSPGSAAGLGAGVNLGTGVGAGVSRGDAGSGASTRDAGSVSGATGLGAGVNPGGHAGSPGSAAGLEAGVNLGTGVGAGVNRGDAGSPSPPAPLPRGGEGRGVTHNDELALTDKERKIHEAGLVSVLKQIHDDLDAAVFAAYGWPATLTDEQILERLVALNAERAAEEARGQIRWLRPEFQCRPPTPSGLEAEQDSPSPAKSKRRPKSPPPPVPQRTEGTTEGRPPTPSGPEAEQDSPSRTTGKRRSKSVPSPVPQRTEGTTLRPAKQPWPAEQAARTKAVQEALAAAGEATSAADLAKRFQRARASTVEEILDALVSLGLAHKQRGGKYQA